VGGVVDISVAFRRQVNNEVYCWRLAAYTAPVGDNDDFHATLDDPPYVF
jgi:hypothetical protein